MRKIALVGLLVALLIFPNTVAAEGIACDSQGTTAEEAALAAGLGPSTEYGHWLCRASEGLQPGTAGPITLRWRYDVQPGFSNNFGGWGPPPLGWISRDQIPHTENIDGTWSYWNSHGNPWPPPGAARE